MTSRHGSQTAQQIFFFICAILLTLGAPKLVIGATVDLTPIGSLVTSSAATGGNILSYHDNGLIMQGIGSNDAFLELRQQGGSGSQEGYNTGAATTQFSTTVKDIALLLSDVPRVVIGGVEYYEFGLSVNETGGDTQVSLDEFQIFQDDSDSLDTYVDASPTLSGLSPVVDWFGNNTAGNNALLQDDVSGSSNVDYLFFVEASAFADKDYVYLHAEMGFTEDATNGEDRWTVDPSNSPASQSAFCEDIGAIDCTVVPEPDCLGLIAVFLGWLGIRQRRHPSTDT